jgi:hypothetical protein
VRRTPHRPSACTHPSEEFPRPPERPRPRRPTKGLTPRELPFKPESRTGAAVTDLARSIAYPRVQAEPGRVCELEPGANDRIATGRRLGKQLVQRSSRWSPTRIAPTVQIAEFVPLQKSRRRDRASARLLRVRGSTGRRAFGLEAPAVVSWCSRLRPIRSSPRRG